MANSDAYNIDRASRVPLYRQIKKYLIGYIRDQRDTDMIPPEIEISRNFDVSRATVRLAIMELVKEGLVERIPGKGTFVRPSQRHLVFTNWLATEPYAAGALAELLERFVADRAGVNIDSVGIPYLETEHQLMLTTSAGNAPDLAALIYLWLPIFARQGALLPVEDLHPPATRENRYPQTLGAVTFDGRPYGVNWVNAPSVLYCNRRLVEEYGGGIPPGVAYFEGLEETFARISERSNGTVLPFSIPVYDDEKLVLFSLYSFLRAFDGGILDESGNVIFNSEATIRAFAWLRRFIRKGGIDLGESRHLENRQLFAHDRLAFLIEGPWLRGIIPTFNAAYRDRMDGIEILPMPKGPNGVSGSVLWNHTLAIFRQCRNPDLARDLIRYLTEDPEPGALYYRQTGMLPVRLDELSSNPVYDDPFGRVLRRQMETALPIPFVDSPFFMPAIGFCARAAREILLGDRDIGSTLNTYAKILEELYRR
jgi:ABC-type glycerol-3-phosphate transport system substrate-binding protein